MGEKVKKLIISLVVFVILILAVRVYFKFTYYPNNPSRYFVYIERDDYNPVLENEGGVQLGPLNPPAGGCFNTCYGKKKVGNCEKYSKKYDYCEIDCYGFLYNNCSKSWLWIIFGSLVK